MYRIDTATAVPVLPSPQPEATPGFFAYAPPGSGQTPTVVSSDWCNSIQEELMSVLDYAGVEPDKASHAQVLQAILSLQDGAGVNGAGSIFGMGLANTPGFETTRISISAGLCRDSANSAKIALGAPIIKRLDAAWAPGSGGGGRDTGALANGQTWHVFAILDPATGDVDALFSQSPTAPALPTGFTKFRRLGAILLEAAATTIRAFVQTGDWFILKLRSTDFAAASNAGGPFLRTITVPDGIRVEAKLYYQSTGNADSTVRLTGVFDPDLGAPPAWGPATQWAQLRRYTFKDYAGNNYSYNSGVFDQFTDVSKHVYTYSNDPGELITLGVLGWRDERGKFF